MKIAYYEENNYHTEIMGTFLEYFTKIGAEIVLYNTRDKSSTPNYFQQFCKFTIKPHTLLLKEYTLFDLIVIGSSFDTKDFVNKLDKIDYSKFVFICHHPSTIRKAYSKVLVVTPLNCRPNLNPNIQYVLPIHNYNTNFMPIKQNILTIIGRFKDANRNTPDLINLIVGYRHLNFVVYIFSRAVKFIPKQLMKLASIYPNKLQIILKANSDTLDKHLYKSKYILPLVNKNSWYHKDRLSGNIALAYNYNVPLIIDEKLKDIYHIQHCICYQNSLSEIIQNVVSMNDSQYECMVKGFMEEKRTILDANRQVLDSILKRDSILKTDPILKTDSILKTDTMLKTSK